MSVEIEGKSAECGQCGGPTKVLELNGVPFSAPFCADCAAQRDAEHDEQVAASEARRTAERVAERRRRSGIPAHLLDFEFSSVQDPRGELAGAIELSRRWALGEINGAVLSGSVGTGKTRVAIAAANMMLQQRKVSFLSGPMLMARLGSGSFTSDARLEAVEILTGTAALVLDDLDKVRPTEYAAEAIFLAVDQRADGVAPLLVTTNMSLAEFEDYWPGAYGEAIASRLQLLDGVKVTGVDRRQR